jgi:Ulp1 family protease
VLGRADLHCLKSGKCLNDAVVNAYLTLLSNNLNTSNYVGFTNSFFMTKLKRDGNASATNWAGIGGERLDVYRRFLVPVATGFHWILIEVVFAMSCIYVYDSLGHHGRSLAKRLIEFMRFQGIKKSFGIKFPPVPKQPNFHDCGVYLLQYAKYLFLGQPIDAHSFNQRDTNLFRRAIYDELLIELPAPPLAPAPEPDLTLIIDDHLASVPEQARLKLKSGENMEMAPEELELEPDD